MPILLCLQATRGGAIGPGARPLGASIFGLADTLTEPPLQFEACGLSENPAIRGKRLYPEVLAHQGLSMLHIL